MGSDSFDGIRPGVYNVDYFCLTDNHYLLVKRKEDIYQVRPSECRDGDLIQTSDKDGFLCWSPFCVTQRRVNRNDHIVKVRTQGGYFELTTGHKLILENGDLVAAGNLKTGDKLLSPKVFDLPNSRSIGVDLAYTLGAFAAEGTTQAGHNDTGNGKWRVQFCLCDKEIAFAAKIAQSINCLQKGYNPVIETFPEYSRKVVSVYSKEFYEFLDNIGALGYCWDKTTPGCIFTATDEEKLAYISALIEGDGGWKNRRLKVRLTSQALVSGLSQLLRYFDINVKMGYRPAYDNNRESYSVSIYGIKNLKRFIDLTQKYLLGWHHLESIRDYVGKQRGGQKYSKAYIRSELLRLYPISLSKFYKETGITQAYIERLYGSWRGCLLENGLEPLKSRWNKSPKIVQNPEYYILEQPNEVQVLEVTIELLRQDIVVYDVSVPGSETFVIDNIVSHNSGSQCAIFCGDVFVDEVTAINFVAQQQRRPLYGYADQHFRAMSKGQVLVQGQFSINFKEAGYLWLILNEYKKKIKGGHSKLDLNKDSPFYSSSQALQQNIEQVINNESIDEGQRYEAIAGLADAYASLSGFSSTTRAAAKRKKYDDGREYTDVGDAENIFEAFENAIWSGKKTSHGLNIQDNRSPDDPDLNPFDIFIMYGDFAGDDRANHTIVKLEDCHIVGSSQRIEIDALPIQEVFSFYARMKI